MAVDDEAARKARAEDLRRQIAGLKKGQTPAERPEERPSQSPGGQNYRALIDKRMHELDRKDRS